MIVTIVCPNCHLRVALSQDGTCPSCRRLPNQPSPLSSRDNEAAGSAQRSPEALSSCASQNTAAVLHSQDIDPHSDVQRLAPHSAKTGPSARKNIGQKPVRGTANCDSADFLSVKLCTVAGFVLGATAAILLKTVLGVSTTAGHIWFGILGVLIGTSLGWTVGNVLQLAPDVRMAVIALVVGVSLIAAGVAPLMYPNFAEEAAQKKLRAAEEAVARRENRRQWEVPPPEAPVVVIDYGTHVVYDREGADRERRRQKGAQEVRRLRSNAQNALNELEIARAPRLVVVATVVGMLLLGVLATANGAFCLLNIRLRQRRTDRRNSRKWEVSERTSD